MVHVQNSNAGVACRSRGLDHWTIVVHWSPLLTERRSFYSPELRESRGIQVIIITPTPPGRRVSHELALWPTTSPTNVTTCSFPRAPAGQAPNPCRAPTGVAVWPAGVPKLALPPLFPWACFPSPYPKLASTLLDLACVPITHQHPNWLNCQTIGKSGWITDHFVK